uniref:Uncharacterized protein n=1 Tax=Candidozyma auris TaxID=498019 RepID=A0A0L0NWP0_CANAR
MDWDEKWVEGYRFLSTLDLKHRLINIITIRDLVKVKTHCMFMGFQSRCESTSLNSRHLGGLALSVMPI